MVKLFTAPFEFSLRLKRQQEQFFLRRPDSLHAYAKKMARRDKPVCTHSRSWPWRKRYRLNTEDFFKNCSARSDRAYFLEILGRMPDGLVRPGDEVA